MERLAEDVFARRGFRGATIREVARRAGCSVGQIYKLYPNKLALYSSIIGGKASVLSDMASQTLAANAPPEERLRRLVYLLLGYFQEHVVFFRILAFETGPQIVSGNRHFFDHVQQWKTEILSRITDTIRDGQERGSIRPDIDPNLAAVSFLGLLHGHTNGWILHKENGMLIDRAEAILDLFFAGARFRKNPRLPGTARAGSARAGRKP